MIEFNKHHYSGLWEKQKHYIATLGALGEPYDFYVRAIGSVISPFLIKQFPCSIEMRQELIKIIMIAQADAINNKLDVSSLKPREKKPGLFKKIFRK